MDKIDELIERYTGGGRCFLQPESKKHFAEDLSGLLAEALAERDARIKELEKELYTLRSWEEDASRENGDYDNKCCICHNSFSGHKRRVACKLCDEGR